MTATIRESMMPILNQEDKCEDSPPPAPLVVDCETKVDDKTVVSTNGPQEVPTGFSPPLADFHSSPLKAALTSKPLMASPPSSTDSARPHSPQLTVEQAKQTMLDQYVPWVMKTYGDAAKTKTITTKKYARIIALLKSYSDGPKSISDLIPTSQNPAPTTGSEAAKFRLWVKSKGFHLGPPIGHPDCGKLDHDKILYLPTGTDKVIHISNNAKKGRKLRIVDVLYLNLFRGKFFKSFFFFLKVSGGKSAKNPPFSLL